MRGGGGPRGVPLARPARRACRFGAYRRAMPIAPALVLMAVTAVVGVTFVQVKDAVALYPLFAFLAVRFGIASATLAIPGARRVARLGRAGVVEGIGAGALLGTGYALQTAGLERTTV